MNNASDQERGRTFPFFPWILYCLHADADVVQERGTSFCTWILDFAHAFNICGVSRTFCPRRIYCIHKQLDCKCTLSPWMMRHVNQGAWGGRDKKKTRVMLLQDSADKGVAWCVKHFDLHIDSLWAELLRTEAPVASNHAPVIQCRMCSITCPHLRKDL